MPTFRLTLRYDGTDFAGSQVQPGERTVQGELERALGRLGDGTAGTTFAGRTDRGVHAFGQVVAVHLERWTASAEELARSLNSLLPGDVAVFAAVQCEESFNPRFEATWREYRYLVVPGVTSPFISRYAWTPRFVLDLNAMTDAAIYLRGRHDFATFASGGEGVPWSARASRPRGTIRTVIQCKCNETRVLDGPLGGGIANGIEIQVVADGFLPQMVRNIAGALVDVGRGARDPSWIGELLAAQDRRQGPDPAPARGLTLWHVAYADNPGDRIEQRRIGERALNRGVL